MQATLKAKVSEIFTKYNFSRESAGFISDVLSEIDNRQDEKFQVSKELFLTQKDKTEIIERIENLRTELTSTLYKTVFYSKYSSAFSYYRFSFGYIKLYA